MYDYMKALYLRFHRVTPRSRELIALHDRVKDGLDREHQKLLLRLSDAEMAYCEEAALESFVEGYCLASGISEELKDHRYSFEDEDEENAKRIFQNEQEI